MGNDLIDALLLEFTYDQYVNDFSCCSNRDVVDAKLYSGFMNWHFDILIACISCNHIFIDTRHKEKHNRWHAE